MSDYLFITIDDRQALAEVTNAVESFVKDACANEIPHNLLPHFRVNVTRAGRRIMIEPFFGAASFRALLRDRRKRRYIQRALTAVVSWASERTAIVDLLLTSDRGRDDPIPIREQTASLDAVFAWKRVPAGSQLVRLKE